MHLLPHPGTVLDWWRVWEVRVALRRMERVAGQAAMLVGDFNALAPADPRDLRGGAAVSRLLLRLQAGHVVTRAVGAVLAAGLTDSYRTLYPAERGWTLPTSSPRLRVDYIFANAASAPQLRRCEVVRAPAVVCRGYFAHPLQTYDGCGT